MSVSCIHVSLCAVHSLIQTHTYIHSLIHIIKHEIIHKNTHIHNSQKLTHTHVFTITCIRLCYLDELDINFDCDTIYSYICDVIGISVSDDELPPVRLQWI